MAKTKSEFKEILARFTEKFTYISEKDIKEQEEMLLSQGENPKNIRIRAISLNLVGQGVIKKLNIGRWRANASLTPEMLGYDPEESEEVAEFLKECIQLGSSLLLPKDYVNTLNSIENSARHYLKSNSIATPWGDFVPWTMNAEINERLENYRQRYFEVIDEIYANWEEIQNQMEKTYRLGAIEVWRKLKYDKYGQPPETWIRNLISRTRARVYTREMFRGSCYFNIIVEPVPIAPSILAAEQAKLAAIEAEKRLMDEFISDEEKFIQERNRQIAAMVEESTKSISGQLDEFMAVPLKLMRTLLYDASLKILGKEAVSERDKNVLINLLGKVRKLNFMGDQQIIDLIKELEPYTKTYGSLAEQEVELRESLEKVAIFCRADLLDLGEAPRSGREVGIPDIITEEMIIKVTERKPRTQQENIDFDMPNDVPEIPIERITRKPRYKMSDFIV